MPLRSGVTAPRQVLQGTTYLVTRRASERRFFLRPSKETTALLSYVLGVVAERYGIILHAVCALSNHLHIVLTDPHARLPEFQRDLDSVVARALNRALGRWESFFERDSYSAVRLETRDDVLDKLVYVLANPVAAGLVRRGKEWPGLWSDPRLLGGEPLLCERPKGFFREAGPMPASARLKLHPPPGFENDPDLVSELLRQLEKAEDRLAAEIAKQGRSFMGVARVLAQKWYARPRGGEPRRGLSPHVACRNKWKRIEALSRLVSFREAYREALARWMDGIREATFPPGTWLMRVLHGVCIATPT